jgi:hypothetical protein
VTLPYESLIFLLGAVAIAFPFLITMKQCLNQVAPENRRIRPSQVWLNMIPVFNLFWVFVTALRFSDSFEAEMRRRPGNTALARSRKGIVTASLFVIFIITLPMGQLNWLTFGAWILALAFYWKEIVMKMVWLMKNPAPARQAR